MFWIPVAAWATALLVAAVVLGFCAYEINWKANRLRADLRELQKVNDQAVDLRTRLTATQERLAATGLR